MPLLFGCLLAIGASDYLASEIMWGGTERIVRKYRSVGAKPKVEKATGWGL